MKNNDLVVLGIISIITLIILFRHHKRNQSNKRFTKKVPKEQKRVRINPIPIFTPVMQPREKFWSNKPMRNRMITIVLCYANWCDNCKIWKPIFEDLGRMEGSPRYIMVEENDKGNNSHYLQHANYYPKILIDDEGKISEYDGERNKEALLQYLNDHVLYEN